MSKVVCLETVYIKLIINLSEIKGTIYKVETYKINKNHLSGNCFFSKWSISK